ncbi:MAG: DUF427 domain-containing protein [Actinomycetota bacterium]|nr:DUF427 domain-containing protein [Actinomycetota bacterium]
MTSRTEGRNYPAAPVAAGHVEPCPRRVRATLGGRTVFDTTGARYVWEWPYYPQYYIPVEDIDPELLVDENQEQHLHRGTARRHGLHVGEVSRPATVRLYGADADPAVAHTARFDWAALDAWFEEDEQVFVHPRNPYTRVDALRSRRRVRIERGGVVLADSDAPVLVFETGLPTRYYFDRSDVRWEHLQSSDTQTACPYKGVTSAYWSFVAEDDVHDDLGWSYDFPTRQLLPIAGLVAFYNEFVDVVVDGQPESRPVTHFAKNTH